MEKRTLNRPDLNPPSKRQRQENVSLSIEQVAAQQQSENQAHDEEALCEDCRAVNWSSLHSMAADGLLKDENRVLRSVNANFEELHTSNCKICAILSIIKPPGLNGKRCVLKALPLSRQLTYGGSRLTMDKGYSFESVFRCTVLAIQEKGKKKNSICLGPKSLAVIKLDDFGSRSVSPSSIDYNRLKNLVQTCEKEHKRCHSSSSRPNVMGLEVIDTKTRRVIEAPAQCKYLALSYMWGKQAGDSSVHDIRYLPPVIKDAISVTNSMGYNYLWVDRYCIRSDSIDKHRMISQMDQIYANASITIIAASDGDTEMGLCGVSKPRQLQQHVDVQDVALLELPLGHKDLTASKWASRGWTYQEGYLSTKRLIFTTTQILFLCNGSYGSECLQQLSGVPYCTDDTMDFAHLIPYFTATSRRFSVQGLQKHVQEYSGRELTRPDDSLNAFLGVLSYYAKSSANMTSPVLQLPWGLIASTHKKKNSFHLHFFWSHKSPATRRRGFPSWSWTGWGGPLEFDGPETVLQREHEVEQGPFAYINWNFSMQEEDGSVVKMHELACKEFEARKDKHRLYQPGPKQLQVSCLVIPMSFQEFDLTEDQRKNATEISIRDTGRTFQVGRNLPSGAHPVLQVWEGIYVGVDKAKVRLDQQVEQQDCILGLIYGQRDEKYDWTSFSCLLVRQVGEVLYERVGMLSISDIDLTPIYRPKSFPYAVKTQMGYLDSMGSVLEGFTISDRQRRYPFTDTAEPRTLFLV